MKRFIETIVVAAALTLAGTYVAKARTTEARAVADRTRTAVQNPETVPQADKLTVKITGIRQSEGVVMIALGDHTKPNPEGWIAGMVSASHAKDGSVVCTLKGKIDRGATLYAFLDTNGNRSLDRDEHGTPSEGCAFGPVVLDQDGVASLELRYFN